MAKPRPRPAERLPVRLKPRASRSAVVGWKDGVLEVSVASPPVEGAANDELVRLLAATLGVARGAVRIASGEHSRNKLVEVDGWALSELRAKLNGAP